MGGLCDAHHVGGNLGVKVSRYGYSRCTGEGSRSHPTGYASDTHEVRHNEIACLFLERLGHLPRAIEILSDLQRSFQLSRKLCTAIEIVVNDWLFDPSEVVVVDQVASS